MMIRYNFRPSLTDHTQVLILVKPFYNASDKDYNYALKKLVVFTHAKIEDSLNRKILLKFTKGYTRDTLEWGKLQLHSLLGLHDCQMIQFNIKKTLKR